MKALPWRGKGDIRCKRVSIQKSRTDATAIIKVTSCAICGSDLHIYDGMIADDEERRRARRSVSCLHQPPARKPSILYSTIADKERLSERVVVGQLITF